MMNKQQSTQPKADQGGVLDLTERNWLPRHCRGDEQAFEQLLLTYRSDCKLNIFGEQFHLSPDSRLAVHDVLALIT